MKKMQATAFKAQCLSIMDDICASGETVVVTKRGKPVVCVSPVPKPSGRFLGRLKGLFTIEGEITKPIIPPEDWDQD